MGAPVKRLCSHHVSGLGAAFCGGCLELSVLPLALLAGCSLLKLLQCALDMRLTCVPAKHWHCHRSGPDRGQQEQAYVRQVYQQNHLGKNSVLLPNRQFSEGECIKGSATPAWFIEMCSPPSLRTQRALANNLVTLPVAATRGLFTGSTGGNGGSPDKQSYDTALMPGPDFSSFSPCRPPGCLSRLSLLPPLGRGLCRHGNLSLLTRGTSRLPLLFMRWRDPLCQPSPGGVCRALLPFLSLSARGG